MPKHKRLAQLAQTPKYPFAVRVIKATTKGEFIEVNEVHCEYGGDAFRLADRLQGEFDDDCDPRRAYVFKGEDKVPVHAGLEHSCFARQRY